jgi:hypothetical protein
LPDEGNVPGYLGLVLDPDSEEPVGTCFQLSTGHLVTAYHVLKVLDAEAVGATVKFAPLAGGGAFAAKVERVDESNDLALLTTETPLRESAGRLVPSESIQPGTEVLITGYGQVPHDDRYRNMSARGRWEHTTLRDDGVRLGRFNSKDLLLGMSGAPVRRLADDVVVGVVTSRHNSDSYRLNETAWAARAEDLAELAGIVISILFLPDPELVKAADGLASDLLSSLLLQEEQQQIQRPYPLPVEWQTVDDDKVIDSWSNIRKPSEAGNESLDLAGRLDDKGNGALAAYGKIPSGRMVVLGTAGSGKSVLTLRLALELLPTNRASGAPVPVIFSLGSWNPTKTSLRPWMTDQLLRDFPHLGTPGPRSLPTPWDFEDVRHWLTFLAGHLEGVGTAELEWWKLGTSMSRFARMLVVGIIVGLVFVVMEGVTLGLEAVLVGFPRGFGVTIDLMLSAGRTIVIGSAFALVHGLVTRFQDKPFEPSRVRMKLNRRKFRRQHKEFAAKLKAGFLLGAAGGLVAILGLVISDGLVANLWWAHNGALRFGLVQAIIIEVVRGFVPGLVGVLGIAIVVAVAYGLQAYFEEPIGVDGPSEPDALRRLNRAHVFSQFLALGITAGIALGFVNAFVQGPVPGLLFGIVGGLTLAVGGALSLTAWGQWVVFGRIWLPLMGRLPWAVDAFLKDACEREVLRRTGAVYQFRHALLQQHLIRIRDAE